MRLLFETSQNKNRLLIQDRWNNKYQGTRKGYNNLGKRQTTQNSFHFQRSSRTGDLFPFSDAPIIDFGNCYCQRNILCSITYKPIYTHNALAIDIMALAIAQIFCPKYINNALLDILDSDMMKMNLWPNRNELNRHRQSLLLLKNVAKEREH